MLALWALLSCSLQHTQCLSLSQSYMFHSLTLHSKNRSCLLGFHEKLLYHIFRYFKHTLTFVSQYEYRTPLKLWMWLNNGIKLRITMNNIRQQLKRDKLSEYVLLYMCAFSSAATCWKQPTHFSPAIGFDTGPCLSGFALLSKEQAKSGCLTLAVSTLPPPTSFLCRYRGWSTAGLCAMQKWTLLCRTYRGFRGVLQHRTTRHLCPVQSVSVARPEAIGCAMTK